MSKVIVVDPRGIEGIEADRIVNDVIVINQNKPEFGSIRFDSKTLNFGNSKGFANVAKRVHFENGRIEDLRQIVEIFGLKPGKEMSNNFKIVVKEQLEPFYEGQTPKTNGEDNEVLLAADTETGDLKPIYRDTLLLDATQAHAEDMKDTFIQYDAKISMEEFEEMVIGAEEAAQVAP